MFGRPDPRDDDARTGRHESRPLCDREVPVFRAISADVHRWLDGEMPETAIGQRPDHARHIALWHLIERDLERRHRLTMPAYLVTRIMEAIAR